MNEELTLAYDLKHQLEVMQGCWLTQGQLHGRRIRDAVECV